jgi:hypothetical protein
MSWHTTGTQKMMQESYPNNSLIPHGRRVLVLERRDRSGSLVPLDKKLENIQAKAKAGDYQSQLRLEAISKLLDPCLEFYESDVERIVNKGYSLQVERGLHLYRLMSQLRLFCEPIGDTVGIACRIKLLNFEELTWEKFLDTRAESLNLLFRIADRRGEIFNGMDLLTEQERVLYHRLKPYFGGRKKPTLKSLALNLLGEENGFYSERNAYNYLTAVKKFRRMHKDELGFSWYFIGSLDCYNSNPKTVREYLNNMYIEVGKCLKDVVWPTVSKEILQAIKGIDTALASKHMLQAIQGIKIGIDSMKGFQALIAVDNTFLASLRSAQEALVKMAASAFNPLRLQVPSMKDLLPNPLPQLSLPPDRK